jgi:hypothetical protein
VSSKTFFDVMRSTLTDLEHSPDLTQEDAYRLQQLVLHFATELEVRKNAALSPATDQPKSPTTEQKQPLSSV